MKFKLAATAIILVAAAGCITVNVPLGNGEHVPTYQWMLQWEAPEEARSGVEFESPLRVKDLDAAGSYQLSGMVVTHTDGTVHESTDNRWAARPGAMLSELLARDLIAAGGFPGVFRTAASVNDLVTLEGYVREFGATQVDSTTWIAVLDVDVTLLSNRGADIVVQKNYRYERRLPEPGFEELSRQLSSLSETWADAVREDIYRNID